MLSTCARSACVSAACGAIADRVALHLQARLDAGGKIEARESLVDASDTS
jgi:hypothetical protein